MAIKKLKIPWINWNFGNISVFNMATDDKEKQCITQLNLNN